MIRAFMPRSFTSNLGEMHPSLLSGLGTYQDPLQGRSARQMDEDLIAIGAGQTGHPSFSARPAEAVLVASQLHAGRKPFARHSSIKAVHVSDANPRR